MPSLLHARVHGAGPTGALAALALAAAGWEVSVHDPSPRDALPRRSRAYAFTHSSRALLERLDLWSALLPSLNPFHRLRLIDAGCDRSVPFSTGDLGRRSSAKAGAAVGWIGLHRPLMSLLLERLEHHPRVRLHLGPSPAPGSASDPMPPVEREPDLVLAADGVDSPTRRGAGIGLWRLAYRQACLAAQVELRGLDEDEAWELLRPEGPFGVLPLGGRHFQLVWSAPTPRCRRREDLSDVAFLDTLAGALPDQLQPDALLDQPRAFPVALHLARRLHRGNTVLIGESAHRCHPVGGQGLNLCWRDVAVLHRLAERAARAGYAPRADRRRLRPAALGRCDPHPAHHRSAGAAVLESPPPAAAAAAIGDGSAGALRLVAPPGARGDDPRGG
jgi:2-octaprenyl-6-methoxyphenol hydroxylase